MSNLALITIMAAIVFALRFLGLLAHRAQLPAYLERALQYAPIAVLSGLTAYALAGQASGDPIRAVAALGAWIFMLATKRMWICILGGFGIYWFLRLSTAEF